MLPFLLLLSTRIFTIQSQLFSSGGTTFDAQLDPLLSDSLLSQQVMQGQQMGGMNSLGYGSQMGMNPYGINNYGIQSFPRFAPQMSPALSQLGMPQLGYGSQLGYSNQLGYGNQFGSYNQLMGSQINPTLLGYNQMYGNSLYGQQGYGNRGAYPYSMRMPFNADKKSK